MQTSNIISIMSRNYRVFMSKKISLIGRVECIMLEMHAFLQNSNPIVTLCIYDFTRSGPATHLALWSNPAATRWCLQMFEASRYREFFCINGWVSNLHLILSHRWDLAEKRELCERAEELLIPDGQEPGYSPFSVVWDKDVITGG